MESLAIEVPFRIRHVTTPFGDDDVETTILQIERSADDFVHITLRTFPFERDVICNNNGPYDCTVTVMGQRITNDINRGLHITRVLYIRCLGRFRTVGG